MNHKQIAGLAVISIADGAKVGTIDQVYVDPDAKRIVGFAIKPEGARLSADAPNLIDVDDIHALGHDAVTLNSTNAVRGDRTRAAMAALMDVDELTKRKVMTEGGTLVGQVAGVEFDERSFGLTQIEVSPGYFKSNKHVATNQIVNVGEMVIVVDAVCTPEGEPADAAPRTEGRFVVGDVTPTTE